MAMPCNFDTASDRPLGANTIGSLQSVPASLPAGLAQPARRDVHDSVFPPLCTSSVWASSTISAQTFDWSIESIVPCKPTATRQAQLVAKIGKPHKTNQPLQTQSLSERGHANQIKSKSLN